MNFENTKSSILEYVQVITDVVGDSLQSQVAEDSLQFQDAWQRVSVSLRCISERLKEWGHILKQIGIGPNQTTVTEISDALNQLDRSLIELIPWLDRQSEQYWVSLKSRLELARNKKEWQEAQLSLSTYEEWLSSLEGRERAPSRGENRGYTRERRRAGEGVLQFAIALRNAVDEGEYERLHGSG